MHGKIFNDIIVDRLVLALSTKPREPNLTWHICPSQIHWKCQTVMTVVWASLSCLYMLQEAAFPPAAERRVMMMMTSLLMMRKRSRTLILAMWALCYGCQCRVETGPRSESVSWGCLRQILLIWRRGGYWVFKWNYTMKGRITWWPSPSRSATTTTYLISTIL